MRTKTLLLLIMSALCATAHAKPKKLTDGGTYDNVKPFANSDASGFMANLRLTGARTYLVTISCSDREKHVFAKPTGETMSGPLYVQADEYLEARADSMSLEDAIALRELWYRTCEKRKAPVQEMD